jgi:hypothetical protein
VKASDATFIIVSLTERQSDLLESVASFMPILGAVS